MSSSEIALSWDDPTDATISGYEYAYGVETAKLTATYAARSDWFGTSVAMDGDTMVVGARYDDGGQGSAHVFVRQSGTWSQAAKLTAAERDSYDEFGLSVAIDGDTIVVGATRDDDGGWDSGSAYVFTKPAGGWASASSSVKLTASDATAGDYLGLSVAIDGDTIVVGASQLNNTGSDSGSAYVFTKPTGGWASASSSVKLTASDATVHNKFGQSVEIDGDTVVIGAPLDTDNDVSSGSVYVFTKPATGWVTAGGTVKLTPSDAAHGDQFGYSARIDGDTIVVGAPGDDDDGPDSGSVYVFTKPAAGWASAGGTVKLTASDGTEGDRLGYSVGIDGDTIVAGAINARGLWQRSGSISVFNKPAGGWATASGHYELSAADGVAGDRFGWSVAIDGDTVVVGAPTTGDYGASSGSVYDYRLSDWVAVPASAPGEANAGSYTFIGVPGATYTFRMRARNSVGVSGPSATATAGLVVPMQPTGLSTALANSGEIALSWNGSPDTTIAGYEYEFRTQVAKLTASDAATGDRFGYALAIDGDTMVVGAQDDDSTRGAAYVFTRQAAMWNQVAKLTASDAAVGDRFGSSVAIDGDTVVVAAVLDEHGGAASGSVYVFTKPASGWVTTSGNVKLTAADAATSDSFGYSVAIDGDTIIAGAPDSDDNGSNSGSVYVFTKPASGWVTTSGNVKLTAADATAGDSFGWSVGVDGDTIAVSASHDDADVSGVDSGSVYVFTKPASGWVTTSGNVKLTAADAAAGDRLGYSVAISGDTIAVAADGDDDDIGGVDSGSVYVFTKPASGWVTTSGNVKLTAADAAAGDRLGYSVAISGDTILAGAIHDDDAGSDSGSAYVFTKPAGGWATASKGVRLAAADATRGDLFGLSVALDGDTVVAGAPWDHDSGRRSGSVYIFHASGWTAVADSARGEANAGSHTVTGLLNGARYDFRVRARNSVGASDPSATVTAVPGVPERPAGLTTVSARNAGVTLSWDNPSDATISGYEYEFRAEIAGLSATDAAAHDEFGSSTAMDGNTMVVGTPGDDSRRGAAYVYSKEAGAWSQVAKLTATDGAAGDRFAGSVAIAGDTIVIGASRDDDGGLDSGSAYVFTKPASGWATTSGTVKLTAADAAADDLFGGSVAIDGDTIVVGARWDDDGGSDSGSAYVFTKPASGWASASSDVKLTAAAGAAHTWFGSSVAIDGDTLVAGAPYDRDGGPFSGAVYVFTKPASGWASASGSVKLTAADAAIRDNLGSLVAIDGDTIAASAPTDHNDGAVYVFTKPASGWATASGHVKLTAADTGRYNDFGSSIAIHGDTIVVGDQGDVRGGSVYVFTEPASGWATDNSDVKLTATNGASGDWFGSSVAVDDGTVVVGARYDDRDATNSGSAHIFHASGWTTVADSAPGGANATSHTVTGLTNGVEYRFRVRARNSAGVSKPSAAATASLTPTPAQPTGLTVRAGHDQATLGWDNPADTTIAGHEYEFAAEIAELTTSDNGFGWSTAVDGDTMVVGVQGDDSRRGAAYVYVSDSGLWGQVGKLTASDASVGDRFGESLTIDGNTIVIGASGDDDGGADSGSAYVFSKPADGWATANSDIKLTAADAATGDRFGLSLAIRDNTIVVGAPGDDDGGVDSGSAYVFSKPAGGWATATETAKLTASDRATGARLGYSLAIDASTVVVGAPGATGGADPGSAYVFSRPASGWANASGNVRLTASHPEVDHHFGRSVAIDDDTVVVGAPGITGGADSGSAYVFSKPAGGWASTRDSVKLAASNQAAGDKFGWSVNIDGSTIVVGAPDDSAHAASGSAYVFSKRAEGWVTVADKKLTASAATAGKRFGLSVTADGDTVVVGAPADSEADVNSGSAHIFHASGWTAVADSAPGGANATSHVISGLINGARYEFRVRARNSSGIGEPSAAVTVSLVPAQPTGFSAGSAREGGVTLRWDDPSDRVITGYEYEFRAEIAELTATDAARNDEFGSSTAMDGNTMVVGAPGDDSRRGAAYVYSKEAGGWRQVAKLTATDGAAGDRFAGSVAIDGDTIVVGASRDDDGGLDSGSAYVFTKPASGWATTSGSVKLTAADAAAGDLFGGSVAIDGDTIVVAAEDDDDGGLDSGSVYVFIRPASGWAPASGNVKLAAADAHSYKWFGSSVAVDGDTVVVGAQYDHDEGPFSGALYVFTKPASGWASTRGNVKLTAADAAVGDRLGTLVAIDGDTIAASAPADHDDGAVYVFTKPASGWASASGHVKLTAADTGRYNDFGSSIAIHGDTIVVGDQRDIVGGSVYVFTEPASGWTTASSDMKLIAADSARDERFGSSVAVDNDTVVVGARYGNRSTTNSGSAHIFHASGWTTVADSAPGGANATSRTITSLANGVEYGFRVRATNRAGASQPSSVATATATPMPPPAQPTGLTATAGDSQVALSWDDPLDATVAGYEYEFRAEIAELTSPDAAPGTIFGDSVAVDGDTMVVGALIDSSSIGAAYVYLRESGAWGRVAKLTAVDGARDDDFGYAVAIDGDTIVVGARADDDGGGDAGSAYVFTKPATGWTTAASSVKLTAADAARIDFFGSSVAVDGDTIVVGTPGDDGSAADTGSAYVFTKPATGWTTAASSVKLTAADAAGGDNFGSSVAVDGDTIVAGAPHDDASFHDAGSVYVFNRPTSGWATASGNVKLTAADATTRWFGSAVAIDGDTIVAGAPADAHKGPWSGSAYVFTKPASGWGIASDGAKLTAADAAMLDSFGSTVAVEADRVVVGARRDDDDGEDSGSAYVFTKPASGWTTVSSNVQLRASNPAAGDLFGWSVAIDDDTVVVSARSRDTGAKNSGSVHVFHASGWTAVTESAPGGANAASHTVTDLTRGVEYSFRIRAHNGGASEPSAAATATPVLPLPAQPTGLTATAGDGQVALSWADPADSSITGYEYELRAEVAELAASDGASRDRFGESAAVDGDVLVVGAPADDSRQGAAYVFVRRSGAWSQAAKLTSANRRAGDQFGVSVAIDGNTIVVGSYGDDAGGTGSGVAHVFVKPATGWASATSSIKLSASDAVAADLFGHSVAIDGDTIVAGAYGDDDGGTDSGAAYVFAKPATGWATATSSIKLTASDAGAGDNLGRSVAIDGDTIVAGAYGDDDGGTDSGAAYVFAKPATGWATSTQTAKLTASSPAAGDLLGWSVAIDGGTVVVGAYGDDDGGAIAGAAYVFTKPATGWATATSSAKLTASDATANDWFGWSIAIDGDTVAVGSLWDDDVAIASGSVYTFAKPAAGWAAGTETAKLTVSSPAAGDLFGYSVAIDGSTVAVGAVFDDGAGQDSGSAYVYELSGWTAVADSAPGEPNASSYTVTGLINDLDYSVRIRSVNRTGASTPSAAVAFTPESACVTAPENVTTPICAAVSGNELTLTFNRGLAAIDAAAASALRFAFLIDGAFHNGAPVTNQSPSLVAVDGATLTLTLGTAIRAGDEVTVRYFASATDNGLKASDGTALADFTLTVTTTAQS
ncbi:fibronectin type III domain-containing protein [Candidatus Poriferisodalis sp.]|uniref:fibronectin type III domain-containing protein n=1 Tax=Candidatus Poriferisodalis sp. TaxID=3101277 RepID=UPI003B019763